MTINLFYRSASATLLTVALCACASTQSGGLNPDLTDADTISPEVATLVKETGLHPKDARLICENRREKGTNIAKVRCQTKNERRQDREFAEQFIGEIQN